MTENIDKLKEFINQHKLIVDSEFLDRVKSYISLLLEWGAVHNLTSSGALNKNTIIKNVIDSIYPLKFLSPFNSFADIGTGAGYPGLILAMARSDTQSYLIEPKQKRVAFLNFVKNSLKLQNCEVLQKRAQDIKGISVELITSRAVTNTSLLLSITQNIKNSESEYLLYKGSEVEKELNLIGNLTGLTADEIDELSLKDYALLQKELTNFLS